MQMAGNPLLSRVGGVCCSTPTEMHHCSSSAYVRLLSMIWPLVFSTPFLARKAGVLPAVEHDASPSRVAQDSRPLTVSWAVSAACRAKCLLCNAPAFTLTGAV